MSPTDQLAYAVMQDDTVLCADCVSEVCDDRQPSEATTVHAWLDGGYGHTCSLCCASYAPTDDDQCGVSALKPTVKQLAYLRSLAARTGTTFAYPTTSAAASAEITRLLRLPRFGAGDARREQRDVQRALQQRPDDATAIRARDIRGYGSKCQWSR